MYQTYCIYFLKKINLKNTKISTKIAIKIVRNNKKKITKLQCYHTYLCYSSYSLKRTFTRSNQIEIFKLSIAN